MPLKINNTSPDLVNFNNKQVLKVVCDGETIWELNTKAETWQLNENILSTIGYDNKLFNNLYFMSDGVVCTSICIQNSKQGTKLLYDDLVIYNTETNTWSNDKYRTLEFSNAPLGEVHTWLEQNGTLIA